MNYEQMVSTARSENTCDEWLFDVAEKIKPGATELIVAIAENPNASEETIIELCLSTVTSHEALHEALTAIALDPKFNIEAYLEFGYSRKIAPEAVGAISNRINSEAALDEIVEILKRNTYNWDEPSDWEVLRNALVTGNHVDYLHSKFPEIFEMQYPGTYTDIPEAEKREWHRWDELDEYYANLKASMTPEEWEAYEDKMMEDSDDFDYFDDLEECDQEE